MDQQTLQRVILNENSHYLLLSLILIATNPLFRKSELFLWSFQSF